MTAKKKKVAPAPALAPQSIDHFDLNGAKAYLLEQHSLDVNLLELSDKGGGPRCNHFMGISGPRYTAKDLDAWSAMRSLINGLFRDPPTPKPGIGVLGMLEALKPQDPVMDEVAP